MGYARLWGEFLRVTTPSATIPHLLLLKGAGPFDLHALSTPPAFILSQDQTLNKNLLRNFATKFWDKRKNAQNFTDLIFLVLISFKSMLIFGVKI